MTRPKIPDFVRCPRCLCNRLEAEYHHADGRDCGGFDLHRVHHEMRCLNRKCRHCWIEFPSEWKKKATAALGEGRGEG
jgi:hypothetical protein